MDKKSYLRLKPDQRKSVSAAVCYGSWIARRLGQPKHRKSAGVTLNDAASDRDLYDQL